ncbi:MAG: family 43 glycosylhydrolase [Bacteroidales bacterium]|nr:family 43 glycosylhydrolase [Bacteroidales bacterium]
MTNRLLFASVCALALAATSCHTAQTAHKGIELGPNPFITHMYTADPSAHVWNDGRLYVYPSHDIVPARGCDLMDKYHVFSTDDMVNWKDHGEIVNADMVKWGRPEGGFMWAPDAAYKNGKYYFYFPHPSESNVAPSWKVGVAVSDYPDRDFKVLDEPMKAPNGYVGGWDMIDPTLFIDDDGQPYLYYGGGGNLYAARVKDNMIELAEPLKKMEGLKDFHEGAWVHKYNGKYYLSYADNFDGANRMLYCMSDSPMGPWEYKGILLAPTTCAMTHGSIVEYKGEWFLFYHNSDLSHKNEYRSIAVDKLYYNADGTIRLVQQHH